MWSGPTTLLLETLGLVVNGFLMMVFWCGLKITPDVCTNQNTFHIALSNTTLHEAEVMCGNPFAYILAINASPDGSYSPLRNASQITINIIFPLS